MRLIVAIVAVLALCQCASPRASTARPIVIVGLAEAPDQVAPRYTMLWRKVDPDTGAFENRGGRRMIEFTTYSRGTLRVPGLPGEFEMAEVEPGRYALDGVYAELREGAITYTAQGNIIGPERPSFEARPGEIIYVGIWQASLDGHTAVVRPWRLDEADLRAVAEAGGVKGAVHLRAAQAYAVPCMPHRMHPSLSREIC
jgi:hypothetical protein